MKHLCTPSHDGLLKETQLIELQAILAIFHGTPLLFERTDEL